VAGGADDAGEIGAALGEAAESDGAEGVGFRISIGICADAGDEADARAEDGEIVREDGRGAAEGQLEVTGQQLTLYGEVCGKPVKDEIEVDFPGDGDVEVLHGCWSAFSCGPI
jgi:hypothetical protein